MLKTLHTKYNERRTIMNSDAERVAEMDTDDSIVGECSLTLSSSHSTEVSLMSVRERKAGLDARRKSLLEKIPEQRQWVIIERESLEMMDLAYLTAATGHEFAILRGKHEDILYHGTSISCPFEEDDDLKLALYGHKYEIFGHSHPGEPYPIASGDDKWVLRKLGQKSSKLISGMTGACIDFDAIG